MPADKRSLLAMRKAATWLIAAGVIVSSNVSARAEDPDAGKAEYLSSCATCHGSDGKGKGPHSSKLKTKPADLTLFAKRNKGVFPLSAVYDAIDGRNAIGSHGIRDVPIWGPRRAPRPCRQLKRASLKAGLKVYRPPDRYESHLDLSCDFRRHHRQPNIVCYRVSASHSGEVAGLRAG